MSRYLWFEYRLITFTSNTTAASEIFLQVFKYVQVIVPGRAPKTQPLLMLLSTDTLKEERPNEKNRGGGALFSKPRAQIVRNTFLATDFCNSFGSNQISTFW